MINSVFSIFYSILSLLPVFMLFNNKIIIVTLVSLLSLTPVFIAYIKQNLIGLEDDESIIPTQIVVFLSLFSILLSYISIGPHILLVVAIFPITMVLVLFYITLFRGYLVSLKIRFIHNKTCLKYLEFLIIVKLITLISASIFNNNINYFWILSFILDIIFYIKNLISLKSLDIEQNGFKPIKRNYITIKISSFIVIISVVLGLAISSNRAIFPYTKIVTFLTSINFEGGEYTPPKMEESSVEPSKNQYSFLLESGNLKRESSVIIEFIVKIISYSVTVILILFLIYLLLYPLISPIIKYKFKFVSIREFFNEFLEKIKTIFKFKIDSNNNYIKVENSTNKKKINNKIKEFNKTRNKEISFLHNQYMKLVKWYSRSNRNKIYNFTVTEFLSNINTLNNSYKEELIYLFNKGFFSDVKLTNSETTQIKKIVKDIIKN